MSASPPNDSEEPPDFAENTDNFLVNFLP